LLSQGANVNLVSSAGCSAIHYAAVNNRKGIVELLLRSGGDPSIPNANGQLAAELCDDTDIHLLLLRDRSLLSASKVLRDFQEEPLLEKSPTKVAVAAAAGAGTRSSLDEPAGIRTPTKLSPSMPPTNPDATSNRGHPVSQTYQLQAPNSISVYYPSSQERVQSSSTTAFHPPNHQLHVSNVSPGQPVLHQVYHEQTNGSELPNPLFAQVPSSSQRAYEFEAREEEDGNDDVVYTAVGINSAKKPSKRRNGPFQDHYDSSGSEDASFSPVAGSKSWNNSEAKFHSPEKDTAAPVLSLSELRKSISVAQPPPTGQGSNVSNLFQQQQQLPPAGGVMPSSASQQQRRASFGSTGPSSARLLPKPQLEVGAFSPLTDGNAATPHAYYQQIPPSQQSPNSRVVFANNITGEGPPVSSQRSRSPANVAPLPPPPLAPLGSARGERPPSGASSASPSNPVIPPVSSVSPVPSTGTADEVSKQIYEAAYETALVSRDALQNAGLEASLRKLLLVACLSKTFDDEFISDILSSNPSLAKGRVCDEQLNSLHEFQHRQQQHQHPSNTSGRDKDLLAVPESIHSMTYLHLAAGSANAAMAALLLDTGASSWAVDCKGRTPLHTALLWGSKVLSDHDYSLLRSVGIATETTAAAVADDGTGTDKSDQLQAFEDICSLLHMAMKCERGVEPTGTTAPVDLLGLTPLGLFHLTASPTASSSDGSAFASATPTPRANIGIPRFDFSSNNNPHAKSTARNSHDTSLSDSPRLPPVYSAKKGCEQIAAAAELDGSSILNSGKRIGSPLDLTPLNLSLSASKSIPAKSPGDAVTSLLLAPGDKSVLPLHPPQQRSGKSPWKVAGTGDRDLVIYAHSSAKLWSSTLSEFPFVHCPFPGRPAWNLFAIASSSSGSSNHHSLCSSLVVDHFPKILASEADKLARFHNSANKPGGLVNDIDTTPELLSELLFRCCQQTDRIISQHPSLKVNDNSCLSRSDRINTDRQDLCEALQTVILGNNSVTSSANSIPGEADGPFAYVMENSVSECCFVVVTADYLALCSVGNMDVILAQRSVAEPRVSFNAGAIISSPFAINSSSSLDLHAGDYITTHFMDVGGVGGMGTERRRRSKCSLVASILSNYANIVDPRTVFGSYLEKYRSGSLRFRSSTDDSIGDNKDVGSQSSSGSDRTVSSSTVRTDIQVFNRSAK
jgi:hypothetical protein